MKLMRLLQMLIVSLCMTTTGFAFSWTSDETPKLPMKGLEAEGRSEWQTAVAIYVEQLLKESDRVDLWVRIATIEHQLKNYPMAIDAYNHAIRLQPTNPTFYKTLSEIYAELNQPALALTEINTAVRLRPREARYLIAKAAIANWNQDTSAALESYQQLLTLSQTENVSMSRAELWMHIGSLQGQLKHYPQAISAYQQAMQLSPLNPAVYERLSSLYAAAQQPKLALEAIDRAIALNPQSTQNLLSKAMLLSWLKEYAQARAVYEKILKASPHDKAALQGRATVERLAKLGLSGQPARPLSPFDQLIATANNEAISHHYQLAALALKRAIAMQPRDASLYKKLSELYATAKNPPLALAAINAALRLAPRNIAYWRAKAALAGWAEDSSQVQASYERILQLKPYDESAMLNLAHSMAWQGRVDKALDMYQQLLARYPRDAEGWIQYAEVLTWTQNYLKTLDALKHYRALRGATVTYQQVLARTYALADWYRSALAINEPLLRQTKTNVYELLTESIALRKAFNLNQALYYLAQARHLDPKDLQVRGFTKIVRTPLRSNVNLETYLTEASDTTKIWDFPVSAQYFLNPTTSIVAQGLYEHTSAAVWSGFENINGAPTANDESVMLGMTKQFNRLNLKGYGGAVKILGENNHGIYDASVNTNLTEKAQITVESLHNLYRPYLVPQTPRSVSLQVMESRNGFFLQTQPLLQKYVNVVTSYSTLSDANHYWHVNVWPKARVFGSERVLMSLGVDSDIWHYHRRATDGYFSPILFQAYEGTVELYYAQSENVGYSVSGGFGIQKDETLPHFFYEEDLGFQAFFGIFTDWELRLKGGYTLRENNIKNYDCWTLGAVLTRRFG